MKRIAYLFLVVAVGLAIFSCEDQSEYGLEESKKGFNLRMIPDVASFDLSVGDPVINFNLFTDVKTIEKITIYVELNQFGSDGPTARKVLKEIPGDVFGSAPSAAVSIKLSDFVGAVGLTLDDLAGGDIFNIYNQIYLSDGRVYPDTLKLGDNEYVNLENSFFTAAASTSFTGTMALPVLCPFVPAEAIGTYRITRDDLGVAYDPAHEPEVIAGPGPNQVTFVNMLGHPDGYDVIVDVNPVTDVATVAKQVAWNSANFGLPYGEATVQGGGFYFSCTGFITLDLEHVVAAGSFGTHKLELTKNP